MYSLSRIVLLEDLGIVDYASAWDYQTRCHRALIERKRLDDQDKPGQHEIQHKLILCEHPHVYTLGKSGHPSHLLVDSSGLAAIGATYYKINRGGDITYHGPGQIVGYPILDLDDFYRDVHRYVRDLEEVIIRVIRHFGLTGVRLPGFTGVWLEPDGPNTRFRKICAIGVHLSRWVTLHGFAFNVNTDLSYFQQIVPCGIHDQDKDVTSIARELGYPVDMQEMKILLSQEFESIFACSLKS